MLKHKITTLKNGLKIITLPMPGVESATVLIGVGAGSRYESRKTNGLAHFMEHMAFKGTPKRPSSLAISTEIDGVGGEFNAFTDKEFTAYFVKLATKHKELGFDLLSDMLQNPLLKNEEIDRERGVIIEEINMYEDTPMRRVIEDFIALMYGDNSMGWDIAGSKESIRGMKREDFVAYINRLYVPKNMVVAVAGKFDEAKVKTLAENYFEQMRAHADFGTDRIAIDQKKQRTKVAYKKTEQAHFVLGMPGVDFNHPDRYPLALLGAILGGGMSSRLFIQIRERRGLAYYVTSEVEFFTDSGFFASRAGVRLSAIEEAIKVVRNEYEEIANKPVEAKELTKAKEMVKGRLILALEDSMQYASRAAGQLVLEGKVRTPEETMDLVDKVTDEDIQRVAKKYLRGDKYNLAVIGPYKKEERFVKILK